MGHPAPPQFREHCKDRTLHWGCSAPGVSSEQRAVERDRRLSIQVVVMMVDIPVVENRGGNGKGTRTEPLEIHPTREEGRKGGKNILRAIL